MEHTHLITQQVGGIIYSIFEGSDYVDIICQGAIQSNIHLRGYVQGTEETLENLDDI